MKQNTTTAAIRTLDDTALASILGGQASAPTGPIVTQPVPVHDPNQTPGLFYPCGLP